MGELHGLAILGHDASQRKYTYYSISNSAGESETATGVKRPDGWTWTSEVKFGD